MDIKIFAAYHKQCSFPRSAIIHPIQAGRAVNGVVMPEYIGDDTGDSISLLNPDYCEMTVHYWAWKNASADYIGFCHYRRYFAFAAKTAYPYLLARDISKAEKYVGSDSLAADVIANYDIITVRSEQMYQTVKEHFELNHNCGEDNLSLILNILYEMHPEFRCAAEKYFQGTVHYFCNMYIMRKDIFDKYCEWLFPMLSEFDKQKKAPVRNDRMDGFIAERLYGVYLTWLMDNSDYRICELPRVDITPRSRLAYFLLPPSTKRRFYMKKLLHNRKKSK